MRICQRLTVLLTLTWILEAERLLTQKIFQAFPTCLIFSRGREMFGGIAEYLRFFRGRFGDIEGGELSEGKNYNMILNHWEIREDPYVNAISYEIPQLYEATSSVYTAMIAERDPKWVGRSFEDYELRWFQSGGTEGVPPKAYSFLEFYLQNDANNVAPLLELGFVNPEKGYPDKTFFTFTVRYTDSDNDAPEFVNLKIGALANAMEVNNGAIPMFTREV